MLDGEITMLHLGACGCTPPTKRIQCKNACSARHPKELILSVRHCIMLTMCKLQFHIFTQVLPWIKLITGICWGSVSIVPFSALISC